MRQYIFAALVCYSSQWKLMVAVLGFGWRRAWCDWHRSGTTLSAVWSRDQRVAGVGAEEPAGKFLAGIQMRRDPTVDKEAG